MGFPKNASNLNDFVRDRQQCLKLQNFYSDWITLNHGVPQGTVFGPLVFIICVNDFKNQVNRNMNLGQFADDKVSYVQGTQLKT